MSYERHPLSAAWPDMAREDFDALVLSIEMHGLRESIMLYDGQILDGWHRYQACQSAGREPQFAVFDGALEAAEAFVCDKHTRRSLTATQRAAAVLAMYSWRTTAGQPKKNDVPNTSFSEKALAKKAGVSEATIEKTKAALKVAPERASELKDGKVSASTVLRDAAPIKAPQKPAEKPQAAPAQVQEDDANAEILRDYEHLVAENARLTAIVDASDIGKAALAEANKYRELARVLQERVNGLMNEKNAALAQAKSWMRKCQAAEKKLKEAEMGVAF